MFQSHFCFNVQANGRMGIETCLRRLNPTFFLSAQVQLEKVKTELTNARKKAMDGNENYLPRGDQVDAPKVTFLVFC